MTGYLVSPPVACPGTVASHNPAPSQGRADIAQYVVQPPSGVAQPAGEKPSAAPVVRVAPVVCSRCHGTGDEPANGGSSPETLASEAADVPEATPPTAVP